MFAKEIFDYPELEEHPMLSNHLGKIYTSLFQIQSLHYSPLFMCCFIFPAFLILHKYSTFRGVIQSCNRAFRSCLFVHGLDTFD
jgi:hypothetical protein